MRATTDQQFAYQDFLPFVQELVKRCNAESSTGEDLIDCRILLQKINEKSWYMWWNDVNEPFPFLKICIYLEGLACTYSTHIYASELLEMVHNFHSYHSSP